MFYISSWAGLILFLVVSNKKFGWFSWIILIGLCLISLPGSRSDLGIPSLKYAITQDNKVVKMPLFLTKGKLAEYGYSSLQVPIDIEKKDFTAEIHGIFTFRYNIKTDKDFLTRKYYPNIDKYIKAMFEEMNHINIHKIPLNKKTKTPYGSISFEGIGINKKIQKNTKF